MYVVSPEEERKATVGRIYRKGRFLIWNERVSGDRILISMNVSSITTV